MNPCGKKWYGSKKAAERGLTLMHETNKVLKAPQLLNTYFCYCCEGWHVGHNYLLGIDELCIGEAR